MRPPLLPSLLLTALPLVAACQSDPEQVAYSRPSVSYRLDDGSDRAQAEREVEAYCGQYGLNPSLAASQSESGGSVVATWECR